MNVKTVHQALSLMGLPSEIGNKIYRELLRSEKCLTKSSNPVFEDSESESYPWTEIHKPHGEASTIQGVSPWLARYEFQTAILRVNSQIHREAIGILYNDNLWVVVTVNDPLFSENMKAAGFPVLAWSCESPLLDTGHRDLVVALDVVAVIHPQYTRIMEDHLLALFEQLKGIRRLFVRGTAQEKRSELQQAAQYPSLDMEWARRRMQIYREQGKQAYITEHWKYAQEHYVAAIAFINDLVRIYGWGAWGAWGAEIGDDERFQEFLLFVCHLKSNLAHTRIKMGNFSSAVRNTTYVITISETTPEILGKAHFRRGLAHVELGEDIKAADDFLRAKDLFPKDAAIDRELKAMVTRWRKNDKESEQTVMDRIKRSVKQMRDEKAAALHIFPPGTAVITVANGQVQGVRQH